MTSDRKLVAAVDLGSTSTKVCLYSPDGRCAASASRPTERYNPFSAQHPEWVFWNPDAVWNGVAEAFRDVLGTTVHREIVRVRLEAAARLLQTTDASAAAISGLVGFASPQHFSFTFRKAYGTTPEAYRRQSRVGLCAGLQKS